jgi:hypothetical protein
MGDVGEPTLTGQGSATTLVKQLHFAKRRISPRKWGNVEKKAMEMMWAERA